MAVGAIKNEQINKKKTSYIGSVLTGVAVVYSSKWIIPITKPEKDEYYFDELKDIGKKSSHAIKVEIKKISETVPKTPEIKAFLNIFDKDNTQKIDKNFSNEVIELLARVKDKALTVKQIEKAKLSNYLKSIRPTAPFIFIGTIIGFAYAITRNLIINDKKPKEED